MVFGNQLNLHNPLKYNHIHRCKKKLKVHLMCIKSNYFLLIGQSKWHWPSTLLKLKLLCQIPKCSSKFGVLRPSPTYRSSIWWSWSQVQLASQAQIVILKTNSDNYILLPFQLNLIENFM